jgi:hypothetical protein
MSGEVIFQDSDNTVTGIAIVHKSPTGMIAWLVKKNIVVNAKQAERYMLIFSIGAILLAIGIYIFFIHTTTPTISPAEQQSFLETENAPRPAPSTYVR